MSDPKRCPFCGSDPMIVERNLVYRNGRGWLAKCSNGECGVTIDMQYIKTKKEAIAHWNRRKKALNVHPPSFA